MFNDVNISCTVSPAFKDHSSLIMEKCSLQVAALHAHVLLQCLVI